ncbi:hypothetical protein L484_020162 [Morus notabilis]|uniref:Uncharacterized protein n=1 Tax=Morus notabilis TaxID=981085 RepID=W9R9W4_9ROSA|nr:hypothetical protein L484_020162 [Morus notabilis]
MTQTLLLLSTKSFLLLKLKPDFPPFLSNPKPNPSPIQFIRFYTSPNPTPLCPSRPNSVSFRVHSLPPRHSPTSPQFTQSLILFAVSSLLLVLRLFSAVLLPNFPARWRGLVAASEEAEARTSGSSRTCGKPLSRTRTGGS